MTKTNTATTNETDTPTPPPSGIHQAAAPAAADSNGDAFYALHGLPDSIDENAGAIDGELGKLEGIGFAIENEKSADPFFATMKGEIAGALSDIRLSLSALRTAARYARVELEEEQGDEEEEPSEPESVPAPTTPSAVAKEAPEHGTPADYAIQIRKASDEARDHLTTLVGNLTDEEGEQHAKEIALILKKLEDVRMWTTEMTKARSVGGVPAATKPNPYFDGDVAEALEEHANDLRIQLGKLASLFTCVPGALQMVRDEVAPALAEAMTSAMFMDMWAADAREQARKRQASS